MLTFANAAYSQTQNKFPSDSLRSGDLVFAIAPGGNAITDVTRGVDGLKIDHVGMVYRNEDSIFVMEATGRKGVGMTGISNMSTCPTTRCSCPMTVRCIAVNWCRR